MKVLRAFPTRIEIEPYVKGEYPDIEKMCSSDYDPATHKRDPIGFMIVGKKLILPRGISLQFLRQRTGAIPTMYHGVDPKAMKRKYHMLCPPRDDDQVQVINFLLSKGDFSDKSRYGQRAINVQPGFGKTYCSVFASIVSMRRTIILCHREKIKQQWIKTYKEKTDLPDERLCEITGSAKIIELMKGKADYDVFIVLEQTLTSYMKTYGDEALSEFFNHIACGNKFVDEAHLCFKQMLHIDFFSNVEKNYYVTATCSRADPKEVRVYNLAFGNTIKFGSELQKEKNVVYQLIFYNSDPSLAEQAGISTKYGVSTYRFADYAFKRDKYKTIYAIYFEVFKQAITHEGRIIVVVPKIEYCELLANLTRERYPNLKIATVHSRHEKKENQDACDNADVIISTIGSLGTGADISMVRSLIIMEQYSSKLTAKQLTGRLRLIAPGVESYAYELVDMGFEAIFNMVKKRYNTLNAICKKVEKIEM